MAEVTSPGHKLGQMIGNFFESVFSERLCTFATKHSLYCDKKGPRPAVRGKRKKVTWTDSQGNKHDMDYVFEKNGSETTKGKPIAFVELAWRRYTKHSRNKVGEIEGALVHLGNTYKNTCCFLGAILCGEWTTGAINQLESHNIHVLYIPYDTVVQAFMTKGINIDYPEDALDQEKLELIHAIEKLSGTDLLYIKQIFISSIQEDHDGFMNLLNKALMRKVKAVIVLGLFGNEIRFDSVSAAIKRVQNYSLSSSNAKFQKFEVYVKFFNGSKVEGTFQNRQEAIDFLKLFG